MGELPVKPILWSTTLPTSSLQSPLQSCYESVYTEDADREKGKSNFIAEAEPGSTERF